MKNAMKRWPWSLWVYGGVLLIMHAGMVIALWVWMGADAHDSLLRVRFSNTGGEQLIVTAYQVFWYPLVSLVVVIGNMTLAVALRGRTRYDWAVRQFWYHWIALSTVCFSVLVVIYLAVIMTQNTV